ncbi:phosphatase YcdX [Streptomyces glaucescens]
MGHEWAVLTDHSPRLTVARGLSPGRLREQLDVVAALNETWAPFRLLTGIECDILEDGSLDQEPELLDRLDVVVVSVHSKLRMDARSMTRRMVAAVRNPHADVLGHCTGRLVTGRGRPELEFDADAVFAACAEAGTAVEIDRAGAPGPAAPAAAPGRRGAGVLFSVDTDAHAPGQLDWQINGCARAEELRGAARAGGDGVVGGGAAGVDPGRADSGGLTWYSRTSAWKGLRSWNVQRCSMSTARSSTPTTSMSWPGGRRSARRGTRCRCTRCTARWASRPAI